MAVMVFMDPESTELESALHNCTPDSFLVLRVPWIESPAELAHVRGDTAEAHKTVRPHGAKETFSRLSAPSGRDVITELKRRSMATKTPYRFHSVSIYTVYPDVMNVESAESLLQGFVTCVEVTPASFPLSHSTPDLAAGPSLSTRSRTLEKIFLLGTSDRLLLVPAVRHKARHNNNERSRTDLLICFGLCVRGGTAVSVRLPVDLALLRCVSRLHKGKRAVRCFWG